MRTSKIAALTCSALVLFSGLACGKTEESTQPANNGGVIAESKSSSGSSSTTKAGSGDKTTTTEEGSDTTDTTAKTTKTTKKTTTTEDSTETTGLSIPDVSGLPGNLDACLKAATAMSTIASQMGLLMSPTATKADLDKLQAQVDEVRKSVPDEIKGDFDTWAKAITDYATIVGQLLDNGGIVNPANSDKIDEASKILDSEEFKTAQANIDKYFSTACK